MTKPGLSIGFRGGPLDGLERTVSGGLEDLPRRLVVSVSSWLVAAMQEESLPDSAQENTRPAGSARKRSSRITSQAIYALAIGEHGPCYVFACAVDADVAVG